MCMRERKSECIYEQTVQSHSNRCEERRQSQVAHVDAAIHPSIYIQCKRTHVVSIFARFTAGLSKPASGDSVGFLKVGRWELRATLFVSSLLF